MRHRILGRAAAAGVALSLVVAAAAFADTVRGDSDTVTAGLQMSRDLGTVAPGAVIDAPVAFELRCATSSISIRRQGVVVTIGTRPSAGGAVAMAPADARPVPSIWPKDGIGGRHRDADRRPRNGVGHRPAGDRSLRTPCSSRARRHPRDRTTAGASAAPGGGLHPHRRRAREHAAHPRSPSAMPSSPTHRPAGPPATRSPPPTPRTTPTRRPRARLPSARCFRSGRRRSPARSPTRAGSWRPARSSSP